MITFFAEVRDADKVEEVEDAMVRIIEDVAHSAATRAEVQRFRNRRLKEMDLAMTDSESVAIELSEWAALGDWRLLMVQRQRISDLTAAEVSRVAGERLLPANRTIGRFVPTAKAERAPVDEAPDAAAVVATYRGGAAIAPGEAFAATVANLEARTRRIELAGGIKAAFLVKKTRGATVHLRLQLHHGDLTSLRGKSIPAALLGALVQRGTIAHDHQALGDELDRLKAEVSITSSSGLVVLDVVTLRDNLEATLALSTEMLRTPRLDRKDLEIVRQEWLAALEQSRQDPDAVGFEALELALSPYAKGDPRRPLSIEERIAALEKVTLAEVERYHRDFWGADHAELVVLGDCDVDATRALIEQQLSAWKARKAYTRMPEVYKRIAATQAVIDTPDKEMTLVLAGANLDARDDDLEYPALELAGDILAGAGQARLVERLRQKDGLSYAVFGGTSASAEDRAGSVLIGATVAPQNAARALAAMQEETDRLVADGVTAVELETFKTTWLEAWSAQLASDDWVVSALLRGLRLDRTLEHEQALRDRIAALTPADLAAVAKKHLDWAQMTRVTAGDAAKMK